MVKYWLLFLLFIPAMSLAQSFPIPDQRLLNGTVAKKGTPNNFTQPQTITNNTIGGSTVAGLTFQNITPSLVGGNQNPPSITFSATAWQTNATAKSDTVKYQFLVQGVKTTVADAMWSLQGTPGTGTTASNGVGGCSTSSTTIPFLVLGVNYNAVGVCSGGSGSNGFGSGASGITNIIGNAVDIANWSSTGFVITAGKFIAFASGASGNNTTGDTGILRNGAGVLQINNGTSGQWGALKLGVRDAGTATITNGLTIGHQSSGTPANGLGTAILFNVDDSTTADQNAGQISASWTDATHATHTSQLGFSTASAGGALASQMTLNGIGLVSTGGLASTGTKFTTSGCSVSATVGGATVGTYTSGTTGACTVVITMNGATGMTAANGWSCWANDLTTRADLQNQSTFSTTTATITGTTVSGDVISFGCVGF